MTTFVNTQTSPNNKRKAEPFQVSEHDARMIGFKYLLWLTKEISPESRLSFRWRIDLDVDENLPVIPDQICYEVSMEHGKIASYLGFSYDSEREVDASGEDEEEDQFYKNALQKLDQKKAFVYDKREILEKSSLLLDDEPNLGPVKGKLHKDAKGFVIDLRRLDKPKLIRDIKNVLENHPLIKSHGLIDDIIEDEDYFKVIITFANLTKKLANESFYTKIVGLVEDLVNSL